VSNVNQRAIAAASAPAEAENCKIEGNECSPLRVQLVADAGDQGQTGPTPACAWTTLQWRSGERRT
jgi:hypothetical protein